jgi:rhodanese-related sulfurtransferase
MNMLMLMCVLGVLQPCVRGANNCDDVRTKKYSGGAYCGIYCVYGGLCAAGIKNVCYDSLISTAYIDSPLGSSLRALERAVEQSGGCASVLTGIAPSAIRNSPCPLLLHVRRPGLHTPYSHWVLYLGMSESGKVRMIDPPYEFADLPLADLLALWDGAALAIRNERHSNTSFWIASSVDHLTALLLAGTFALTLPQLRWVKLKALRTVTAIMVSSVGAGHAYHSITPEGFISNPQACGLVAGSHIQPDLVKLDTKEVKDLLSRQAIQLVDARHPDAFAAFHLPGAINLPVFAGLAERSAVIDQLAKDRRVVVYCLGPSCDWAETIASDLLLRGKLDVALYPGGVRAWRDSTPATE